MKYIFILLVLVLTQTLSGVELNINMGMGGSYSKTTGQPVFEKDFWTNSSSDFDHSSALGGYTWLDIESDQAYWPKVFVKMKQLKSSGTSFLHVETQSESVNTVINIIEKEVGKSISQIEFPSSLNQTDLEGYLYYEYFEDSNYPTIGLGAGIKSFNFHYFVTLMEGVELTSDGGDSAPMLFFKSRYELHETGSDSRVSFEVGGNLYLFGDSDIYDYQAKVEFLSRYNENTDIGVELGYEKSFADIKGDDIDTVSGHMNTSGLYVGLVAKFK